MCAKKGDGFGRGEGRGNRLYGIVQIINSNVLRIWIYLKSWKLIYKIHKIKINDNFDDWRKGWHKTVLIQLFSKVYHPRKGYFILVFATFTRIRSSGRGYILQEDKRIAAKQISKAEKEYCVVHSEVSQHTNEKSTFGFLEELPLL